VSDEDAALILIDPKQQPKAENDITIETFWQKRMK